ncbi:MAG: DinB family protein [Anaerolineae bacterium]|nr:DinB family protein [Anaerolineae bacterium]
MSAATDFGQLVQLIQAARGLEAGGYYGLAKLLWALAYSAEVKASNAAGIPRSAALDMSLLDIINNLKADGTDAAVIGALEKGLQAVREDRTVPYVDIPDVYVSRTKGEIFVGEPPELTDSHEHNLALREFKGIWYFESMSPSDVLEALKSNPATIQKEMADLSPDQLLIAPAHSEWNMHQLLWHLMSAQDLLAERVNLMLTQDNPNLESKATWAQKDQSNMSTGDVLEHYLDSRHKVIDQLRALPSSDWWRTGWHDEFGKQTVLSQATYFARHEVSHMPQFAQIIQTVEG